jgi:hypothetical protein
MPAGIVYVDFGGSKGTNIALAADGSLDAKIAKLA